jgi:hypothetical protein
MKDHVNSIALVVVLIIMLLFFSSRAKATEGVYLWKSESIYSELNKTALLEYSKKQGLDRVYWGVSAEQVRYPALFESQLRSTMDALTKNGTESWLLLGEPSWILPEHRKDLLSVMARFESMPFSGIMLDLEVEQLGYPVPDECLERWLQTLSEAVTNTQKTVEITAHWRWFDQGQDACWACRIQAAGVRGATLMIYSTNIDRIAEIVENAERPNGFKLRVAQSLEPFLSKEESWGSHSREHRQQGLNRLRQVVKYPLDWQAYEFIDSLE